LSARRRLGFEGFTKVPIMKVTTAVQEGRVFNRARRNTAEQDAAGNDVSRAASADGDAVRYPWRSNPCSRHILSEGELFAARHHNATGLKPACFR
jgi:hypothetical protein